MACEEEKCLECGMHRDRGTCRWCKREKNLEELKARLAKWDLYEKANILDAIKILATRTWKIKQMIEKIVEILDER